MVTQAHFRHIRNMELFSALDYSFVDCYYPDSTLLYVGRNRDKRQIVVFDDVKKERIFQECHDSSMGAHQGINRTLAKISQRFYWIGMKADIVVLISRCDKCQRMSKIKTMAPELKSIQTSAPWNVLGADLVGPLPTTVNGNKFILTITCLFSKWFEAFPLPNKSALEVSKNLKNLFFRFGAPKRVITDQGREFVNALNDFLFKSFQVKHLIASAYHPQTNGQDERSNQTIKRAISKLINERQDDWDDHLLPAAFGINTCQQSSTKRSPYFVMFGREARLFSELTDSDVLVDAVIEDVDAVSATPSDIDKKILQHQEINAVVKENILKAQAKQKKNYEKLKSKGVRCFSFQCGDVVLKRNARKKGRVGGKLEHEWLWPYKIESISASGVTLSKNDSILQSKVNISHLKPYIFPADTAPLCTISGTKEEELDTCPISLEEASIPHHAASRSTLNPAPSTNMDVLDSTAPITSIPHQAARRRKIPTPPTNMDVVYSAAPITSILQAARRRKVPARSVNMDVVDSAAPIKTSCKRKEPGWSYILPEPAKRLKRQPATFDVDDLIRGKWLNDDHIDFAHYLIAKQFPSVHGLQSCAYLQGNSFGGYASGPLIQIVNVNKSHWILLSTIGVESPNAPVVRIYDSLGISVPQHLKGTCAALLCTDKPLFHLHHMDIHQQVGGDDCGLFAIANAFALSLGHDPTTFVWDQSKMRSHFLDCFRHSKLALFPFTKTRRTTASKSKKITSVEVFCICRKPSKLPMAMCCKCKEWFHQSCSSIDENAFVDPDYKFTCRKCEAISVETILEQSPGTDREDECQKTKDEQAKEQQNLVLLKCIQNGKVDDHLGVFNGTIDSKRHRTFTSNVATAAVRRQLRQINWFSPLDDDEQCFNIIKYLENLFEANFTTSKTFDLAAYLFEIWTPEAIMKAMSLTSDISLLEGAKKIQQGIKDKKPSFEE